MAASNHLFAYEFAHCNREKPFRVLPLTRDALEVIKNISRPNAAATIDEMSPGASKNMTGTRTGSVDGKSQMSPSARTVWFVPMHCSDDRRTVRWFGIRDDMRVNMQDIEHVLSGHSKQLRIVIRRHDAGAECTRGGGWHEVRPVKKQNLMAAVNLGFNHAPKIAINAAG